MHLTVAQLSHNEQEDLNDAPKGGVTSGRESQISRLKTVH